MCDTTGELGYDGPLYDGLLPMTDDVFGRSPMHIKYVSYVYDRFCIWRTNCPGPIESAISKFACIAFLWYYRIFVIVSYFCDTMTRLVYFWIYLLLIFFQSKCKKSIKNMYHLFSFKRNRC